MTDQATHLRRLVGGVGAPPGDLRRRPAGPPPMTRPARPQPRTPHPNGRLARAIAVTSGKGGVGKSNIAVNLAVCLARLGRRVCLLDADLGLANADLLCGLTPRLTLEHVVCGRCRLAEAMLLAPGGFRLIPGACGVARLADLGGRQRLALLEQLTSLERVADIVIIDTAAGLSTNVLAFAAAARRVIVATTPEPTAMTDGYGMIKALAARAPRTRVDLVVNMAASRAEAESVFGRMDRVSRTFLGRSLELAGIVPTDPAVREAVRHRVPFVLFSPDSRATAALYRLAHRVAGVEPAAARGTDGFFTRLAAWFSPGPSNPESA
ncbi:MAG: MinD/ParA family protein [Planctomycetota bacterium]